MARRPWSVFALIVVLLVPFLVSLPIAPLAAESPSKSLTQPYSPPLPYGGEPVGRYTGTGGSTNIRATYNKTLGTPTPTNVSNDFSVALPVDWDVSINTSLSSISARPIVLDVETNETVTSNSLNIRAGMSFQITNSCYLYSVMVRVEAGLFELLDSLDDLYVSIFNATEDSGRPKPDRLWSTRLWFDIGDSTDTFDGWINATWVSPVYLTTSTTYNNYYFVVLVPESGATVSWQYRTDAVTGDNGYAWQWSAGWSFFPIDYFLNVSLLPMGLSPTPSQISMNVNGSTVTDGVGNDGWWASTFTASSSLTLFNVTATWPVTFDYTYLAYFSRNFIGLTDFRTEYQIALTVWNITTSITFPNVNANANSRTINFSLPAYWEAQLLLNGTTSIPFSRYKDNSTSPGSPGWLFLDEPSGAGNSTLWRVVSSDVNCVQTPIIRRGGSTVTGQEVNITDTLSVWAQVSTFSDGQGRFNPYDELGTSLNEWLQSPDITGLLMFPAFSPASYSITNVTMQCEVVWNNSFHAGVGVSSVDLVYPTTLTGDPATYTSLIGDNVNIRVYYFDSENSVGVPNAEVNVTFSGSTYSLGDVGSGYYESSIDTSTMGLSRGIHGGVASADRPGYSPTTTPITLTLWSKTQLVANWTSLTINYTESVTLEVNYSIFTPLGEGGITGALVNISGPGYFNWLAEEGGGNYSIQLEGTVLGVGTHNLLVNASKPGMYIQENSLMITLNVDGEPTTSTGSAPSSVDGGEPFNVTITYRKQSDGSGITGATISCLLNDSTFTEFVLFDLLNGTYRAQFILNVSGTDAVYNITLTASRSGYYNSSYDTFVDVLIRQTTINVQVLSSSPVVHNAPFEVRVTYEDLSAQGVIGATIQGNWSIINFNDNLDGTYTVTCVTTGATAGWWTISFNISAQNYEIGYFNETFYLVWATSLTPENGDYSPSEYENETLVLDVLFWDTSNSLGIDSATVWANFQSTLHSVVSMGSGVYRLTLNLTDVTPATYLVTFYAQRTNFENKTLILSLQVLAKHDSVLSVSLPPPNNIVEGLQISVTVILTLSNGTPITGADVGLNVWIHYANGTNQMLYSEIILTDAFGARIVLVQLPAYPPDFWTNPDDAPYLWSAATYNGTGAIAQTTANVSEVISQAQDLPWWFELLMFLLPFIALLIVIIIIIWAYYAKRVKPRRLAQQEALEASASNWAQRMMGLMDLRALFVTYAKTGLPIFTYDFAGGEMPSTLLSGFLSAVNAFYSELSGELDRESQLRDIDYKDLHLSLHEGQYVVSVLILDSSPSEVLTQSLAQFSAEFETRFGKELASFEGRIDVFDKASEIVEASFHGELLIAYECVKAPSRGFTRKIYDLALALANDEGRVYLPQLFVAAIEKFGAKKKFEIANALERLHEQGCLLPANDITEIDDDKSDNPSDPSVYF